MTGPANPFDGDRLQDSTFARADAARASFDGARNANRAGMRIEGVLATELLETYARR